MYAIRSYYGNLVRALEQLDGRGRHADLFIAGKDRGTRRLRRYFDVGPPRYELHVDVITSYSIHYTKLYESLAGASDTARDRFYAGNFEEMMALG